MFLGSNNLRQRLRPNAIPSQNFSKSSVQIPSPKKRVTPKKNMFSPKNQINQKCEVSEFLLFISYFM